MGGEERKYTAGSRALFMVFITFRSDLHRILSTDRPAGSCSNFPSVFLCCLFFSPFHTFMTPARPLVARRVWNWARVRRCDDFIKRNGFLFHFFSSLYVSKSSRNSPRNAKNHLQGLHKSQVYSSSPEHLHKLIWIRISIKKYVLLFFQVCNT